MNQSHGGPGVPRRRAGGGGTTRRGGPGGGRLKARSSRRTLASMGVMVVCLGAIVARLLFVQGIDAATYQADARSEYVHEISYLGERGAILDRNGDELAISVPMTTVYADPFQVTNPRGEAELLAGPLGLPEASLQTDLSEDSGFVYLAHTIPNVDAARVNKLLNDNALPGVYTMQEPKRFYPAGQLASPLLGTVGAQGEGLSGLEYQYNGLLAGQPGKLVEDMDPDGGQIPGGPQEYRAPVRGDDLVLSIDEHLQYDAEQALARAIVAAQAQSGMALIMNSKTGELLAVAQLSMPSASQPATLDEPPALPVMYLPPGATGKTSSEVLAKEQPVEAPTASAFDTVYEPGSVEKAVTVSAALQSGSVQADQYFEVPNDLDVAGSTIYDAWEHPTLDWSIPNIIAHSSDIGTIEVAQRMGMPTLYKWIYKFGLGQRTDINFPGESTGLVPSPSQWSGTTIATVPIGQGIAVTAIQMLDVYNTIANGGMYVPPRLVDGYVGPDGREHLLNHPAPHRVVSKWVAQDLTSMLEGVVKVGTGMAASLVPYTVAGKTGTALVPSKGGYIQNDFVSSFAGFVPAEDPAVTAMVVVEGTHQYGAEASAPVFATIARDALQDLGIPAHKPDPPVPGLPLGTPYGGEGAAAGLALPGLTGSPNEEVSPSALAQATKESGGALKDAASASTTTTTTVPATTTVPPATTTAPEVATTTVPEVATTTVPPATTTTVPEVATTTVPEVATTIVPLATTTTVPEVATTTVPEVATTTVPEVATTTVAGVVTTTLPAASASATTLPAATSTDG